MGFFKKILKDVAGDYVPDVILNKVIKDDDDDDEDDEELDDEEEDIDDDEEEEISARKKRKSNVLNTPPPPAVPVPQESLSVMVAVNGESYGPYEKVTLIDMIKNGSLTRETYVYIQGMSEWRAAKDVPQVSVLFAPAVPKPAAPPVPWSNPTPPPTPAPAAPTQSNNGFSAKLNSLIESAVADGEISDLERQVLVRNAQAEGVAMDEFVMVLEARLYERRQELMRIQKEEERKAQPQVVHMPAPAAAPAPGATPKQNAASKCLHCGAPVKQLATSCPECGYEYPVGMGGNQGTASERLAIAIEKARAKAVEDKNKSKGLNPFSMYKSLVDGSFQKNPLSDAHAVAIKNFPVPNNKVDILDLFTTCATNSKSGLMTPADEKPIATAYKKKASEILLKARIVLKDDPELLQNIESIAKDYKIK